MKKDYKKEVEVKICGVTNYLDAKALVDLNVNYIGVVYDFKNGKRSVNLEEIIEIRKAFSKNIKSKLVVVCVDKSKREFKKVINYADIIQLHGDESAKYCKELKRLYKDKIFWKALKINSEKEFSKISNYIDIVDNVLLDAGNSVDKIRNNNKILDIELIKKIQDIYKKKFIVAGGIGLDNIEEIMIKLNPKIIDASSKFEITPRKKDIELIKIFLKKYVRVK